MKKQYISSTPDASPVATEGSGLWLRTTGNGLVQLAEKLPTAAATDIRTREDVTVPTPWSSVVSFDILLESVVRKRDAINGDPIIDYGTIQAETENDWRALITLIALRKVRNIPIEFKTVDLAGSEDSFCKEIFKQIPTGSIFADNEAAWSKITLILLEDEVIGVLTPTNLVCSRYYYNADSMNDNMDAFPKAIAWLVTNKLMVVDQESGLYKFTDPVSNFIFKDNNFTEQPESVEYICAWLNKVKGIISNPPFSGRGAAIDKLIDAFLRDINIHNGQPVNVPNLMQIVPAAAIGTPVDLINNIQGQYSLIGMLTAIAFSKVSDYDVVYQSIGQDSPYKNNFNDSMFGGPVVSAVILTKKDKLGNCVEQYCLGALSSNYLITVANNNDKPKSLIEIGLIEGAEYVDPVKFAAVNAERYVYITEWMTKLSAMLQMKYPLEAGSICSEISVFLTRLNNEFTSKYSAGTEEALKAANYNNNAFVTVTPGAGNIDQIFSNLTVQFNILNTGIANNVTIVGTSEMAFSEQSIGSELMAVYSKQLAGDTTVNIIKPDSQTIFDTSSIFKDKIYYVEMDKQSYDLGKWRFGKKSDWSIAKQDDSNSDRYAVLWPINSAALAKMGAENILQNLSFRYDAVNDKCYIILNCKLANGGSSTVTKEYTGPFTEGMADHDTIDQSDIPGFSVWPYVKNNGWYSVYKSEMMEMGQKNYDAVLMPKDITETAGNWNLISDENFKRQPIYRKALPEYLEVHDSIGADIGWIRFEPPTTDIEVAVTAGNVMTVGLDFGTSSTAVYAKIGSGNLQRVDFSAIQSYTPVAHSNDDMSRYFVPNEYNSANYFYPSILRLSSNQQASSKMLDLGNIVYKYEYEKDSVIAGKSLTKSDMKWDGSNNKKVYLTQVIMQTIMWGKLNGASKINWHASYPSAFSKNMQFNYKTLLDSVVAACAHDLGVESVDSNGNTITGAGIVELETESIASATYLMTGGGAKNMIVIDIGGGSTDISLWGPGPNGPNAKVQSSFNIASRKIFLEPLVGFIKASILMQECIAKIKVGSEENPLYPFADIKTYIENGEEDKVSRLVEQALLNHHENIIAQMHALPTADPARQSFEHKVISGFFAIVYFTVEAVKSGLQDLNVGVDIALVGNGAKLYNWILDGYMQNINDYLKSRINEITGLPIFNAIQPVNHTTAKTEAAQGLLMAGKGGTTIIPSVLAGIDMSIDYTKDSGAIQKHEIKEDEFFFDAMSDPSTDIVKLCLEGVDYRAQNCSTDMDGIAKHYNKFMNLVVNDIFKKAFPAPDLTQEALVLMKGKVDGLMNESFKTGMIQSPLFCVLVTAIEML